MTKLVQELMNTKKISEQQAEELVLKFQKRIYGNGERAEDILQEEKLDDKFLFDLIS